MSGTVSYAELENQTRKIIDKRQCLDYNVKFQRPQDLRSMLTYSYHTT